MSGMETTLKPQQSQNTVNQDADWQKRQRDNVRLGVFFGIIVLAIFLGSMWKYRPF
jgi:hypothetical protein